MNSAAEKPLPPIKEALAVVDAFQLQAVVDMHAIACRNRIPMATRAGHIRLSRDADGSTNIYWGDGPAPEAETMAQISEAHHAR